MKLPSRAALGSAAALALIAVGLAAAQHRITVFEDEVIILANAGRLTAGEMILGYLRADTILEHPPLYDLLLRGWMLLTDSRREWLRLPSIALFTAGLALLAAAAGRRWGARGPLIVLAAAWPAMPFFAIPAHWAAFAFFATAGMVEAFGRWTEDRSGAALARFGAFSLALLYTSYFGWAVLAGFAALAWVRVPEPAAQRRFAGVAALVAVGFLPLVPEFLRELGGGTRIGRSVLVTAADAAYHGYALFAGEAVAPWTGPAAAAAAGVLLLVVAAVRTRAVRPELLLLAGLFAAGVLAGILNAKRLVVFAPFFLFLLAGVWRHARPRALVAAGAALAFLPGWIGMATGSTWATFRYIEPWEEVYRETMAAAQPGDTILCNHPSFYFQARYALGWDSWDEPLAMEAFTRSGFTFAPLPAWEDAVPGRPRVIQVRSAVNPWLVEEQERASDYLRAHYRAGVERRWLRDSGSALKNRFTGNQPPWRIQLTEWEREE